MKTHTYVCDRCGWLHRYFYTFAEVTASPTKACIWGGCSGTARPRRLNPESQPVVKPTPDLE